MLDIKELTMEHHKNAERQEFVRILMSGQIDENYMLPICTINYNVILY